MGLYSLPELSRMSWSPSSRLFAAPSPLVLHVEVAGPEGQQVPAAYVVRGRFRDSCCPKFSWGSTLLTGQYPAVPFKHCLLSYSKRPPNPVLIDASETPAVASMALLVNLRVSSISPAKLSPTMLPMVCHTPPQNPMIARPIGAPPSPREASPPARPPSLVYLHRCPLLHPDQSCPCPGCSALAQLALLPAVPSFFFHRLPPHL